MPAPLLTALDTLWIVALAVALGLWPGTLTVRALRLPAAFWMPVTLAASALVAYVLFWIFFLWPRAGEPIALSALVLGVGGWLWCLESPAVRASLRDPDAWLPGLLALLLLVAYLAHLAWPDVRAWERFTIPIPAGDNLVPNWLAERIYNGYYHLTTPPPLSTTFWVTRSSDRPPLLAAIVVSLRPALFRFDLWTYQVIGTTAQVVWLPALYALGRTMGLRRRQIVFGLAGAAFSGFFLLQSLQTWPKLVAAFPMLTAIGLIVYATRDRERRTAGMAAAIGTLLALALLGHGGPFFSIVALPILVALIRAWWLLRLVPLVALSGMFVLLLAPWLAYQTFYDPPGNALVKLHLAGVEDSSDPRGSLEAIVDAYRGVRWSDYVRGRWDNVREQWLVFGKSGRSDPIDWTQWQQFFHHLPALDVLVLGVLPFAGRRWRRARPVGRDARAGDDGGDDADWWLARLTWYASGATLVWIVLLFPPGSAMIHHGSYATTALLFFCAAAWVATLSRRVGDAVLILHVALFAIVWMLPMRVMHTVSPPPVWRAWVGALMIAAFAAFAAALRAIPSRPLPTSSGVRHDASAGESAASSPAPSHA